MTELLTPAILFIVFHLFHEIQASHLLLTSQAEPIDIAPLERKLWLDPPLALYATMLGFAARIAGVGFLIYFGFQTKWWYPLVLFPVSLLVIAFLKTLIRLKLGLLLPSLLGLVIVPATGVAMYLTV